MRSQFRPLIESVAATRHLDPDLLEAQLLVESSDDPHAFRWEPAFYQHYIKDKPQWASWGPLAACSYGLMQLMGAVAIELGFSGPPQDLLVPNINLYFGVKKLAQLKSQCGGDIHAALCAYNGGLLGNDAPPYRNQGYLDKVLALRDTFPPPGSVHV